MPRSKGDAECLSLALPCFLALHFWFTAHLGNRAPSADFIPCNCISLSTSYNHSISPRTLPFSRFCSKGRLGFSKIFFFFVLLNASISVCPQIISMI